MRRVRCRERGGREAIARMHITFVPLYMLVGLRGLINSILIHLTRSVFLMCSLIQLLE